MPMLPNYALLLLQLPAIYSILFLIPPHVPSFPAHSNDNPKREINVVPRRRVFQSVTYPILDPDALCRLPIRLVCQYLCTCSGCALSVGYVEAGTAGPILDCSASITITPLRAAPPDRRC